MDEKRQEPVMLRFQLVGGNTPSASVLLCYRVLAARSVGKDFLYAALHSMEWSEGCNEQHIRLSKNTAPTWIHYRQGQPVPEFEGWRREGSTVRDITAWDVTFDRFWNQYAYKVGNKARAVKLWNALPEMERILALGAIAAQRRHSESRRTDMPYPETYLSQRRWENQF